MTKTLMEFKDIMWQKHYRSIIELTYSFQNPDSRGKNNRDKVKGLRLIHYRYALQKNAKETISAYNQVRMRDFFGDKLGELFRKSDKYEEMGWPRDVYRDCIKSGNTINNFFKKLVKDYKLLDKKKGENGKSRYTISSRLSGEYRREGVKNALDTYNPEIISSFEIRAKQSHVDIERIKKIIPDLKKIWISHTIFGMPTNFLDLCNKEEKDLITEYLTHIHMCAAVLIHLKYKKTKDDTPIGIFADAMCKLKHYI